MRYNLIWLVVMTAFFGCFTWFLSTQIPSAPDGSFVRIGPGASEDEVVIYDPRRDGSLSDLVNTIPPADPAPPNPQAIARVKVAQHSATNPNVLTPGVVYCPTADDPDWQRALLLEAGRNARTFARLDRRLVVMATVFASEPAEVRRMEIVLPAGTWLVPPRAPAPAD